MLHRAASSFLKMGVTFPVLRMLRNIDVLWQMLANNEMGLLKLIFEKLFGMLTGSNAFLAFSELKIEVTSYDLQALQKLT